MKDLDLRRFNLDKLKSMSFMVHNQLMNFGSKTFSLRVLESIASDSPSFWFEDDDGNVVFVDKSHIYKMDLVFENEGIKPL